MTAPLPAALSALPTRSTWVHEFAAWKAQHEKLQAIADRIQKMRNDRARRLCAEAGLCPDLLGIHPHNAMVSFKLGKPWPNVNYSKVRACQRVLDHEFDASRVVDRWASRTMPR